MLMIAVHVQCKSDCLVHNILQPTNLVIEDWTADHSLCLNSSKTQNMESRLVRNKPNDDSVNLLGVIVQPNVKLNVHIDDICKKVAKGILCLENLSRL